MILFLLIFFAFLNVSCESYSPEYYKKLEEIDKKYPEISDIFWQYRTFRLQKDWKLEKNGYRLHIEENFRKGDVITIEISRYYDGNFGYTFNDLDFRIEHPRWNANNSEDMKKLKELGYSDEQFNADKKLINEYNQKKNYNQKMRDIEIEKLRKDEELKKIK